MHGRFILVGFAFSLAELSCAGAPKYGGTAAGARSMRVPIVSCFLLRELGVGEVRRAPAVGCAERVTPASTFKIAHALAALDAGVVKDSSTTLAYDGSPMPFPAWRRDQTLASAMRYSVVWYFQRVADALGPAREREYLTKFAYGNEDPSGNPRRFWIEDSLLIAPDEQEKFLVKFFEGSLPVSAATVQTVRDILVQPDGVIMNATGAHEFAAPWPAGTVVSAKTGSASYDRDDGVQWLVGSVRRGERTWVFVSCVAGRLEENRMPAVELAARALREEDVL
ncbi:MAG TPA: penicillin-binding transpeptidase domain-containing protein [Polyangiaceae bacterium]|jgi:beta-lactamase class D|nr:penicillin-binding transpeptidase domain-containing protein [Polyangiaceae bacterium]